MFKIRDSAAAGTTEYTAEEKTLDVSRGVITRWIIFFPDEASNLLHLKIFYHDQQLIPFNREEDLYGGGIKFDIDEFFELSKTPYKLVCKAWNTDTAKAHEYLVHVIIMPEKYMMSAMTGPGLWERLKGFFRGEE